MGSFRQLRAWKLYWTDPSVCTCQPRRRMPGNGLDCLDRCFLASEVVLVASVFETKTSLACLELNILYQSCPFVSATTIPLYIYWIKFKRACIDMITLSCANNFLYVMPCFLVFRWSKLYFFFPMEIQCNVYIQLTFSAYPKKT